MGGKKLDGVQDKAKILAGLPADITRIQVTTELGHTKWKDPAEVVDSDVLVLKADGSPFVMKNKPGRKQNVQIQPANPVVAVLIRQKQDSVDNDPIYKAAQEAPESPEVLSQIVKGLAEEQASIAFERTEAERNGKETSALSNRRVQALKALADTWLKRKEQVSTVELDFTAPSFKALFGLLMETFKQGMEGVSIRPEMIETVFARVAKSLSDPDWENEARSRMKQAG